MAKKPNKTQTAATGASRDYLGEAVASRVSNIPMMVEKDAMLALINDPRGPLVEFNENMADGNKIAFRATELGVGVHAASQQPQTQAQPQTWGAPQTAAPQTAAPPPNVKFDDNVPVPAPRRGGRGSGVYGFEHMVVGQSFYIPSSPDNPNPAKRIASTVSSASKRLDPKKYLVRSVDETAQGRGKGARVWRTA